MNGLRKINWAFAVILVVAFVLRFWGIGYGLPYTYGPDEPTYVSIALRMLQTGDLNPHWWYYPSLMHYLNAFVLSLLFGAGQLFGYWQSVTDLPYPQIVTMGVGILDVPAEFWLTRGAVALFSTVATGLIYLIARRLHPNKWVGILAALVYAVSPTIVEHSHRVGPDIFAMFFMVWSFLFSIMIVDQPKTRYYLGAGIATGLAIASKYNSGLIIVPLGLAHLFQFGIGGWRRKELWLGLLALVCAFFVATPFALFDFWGFWEGVRFQAFSYSTEGHAGQEGNALAWYVNYLWTIEGWTSLFGALAAVYYLFSRSKSKWMLVSFPIIYFALVSSLLVRNARTIMLMIPFLDILASMFVVDFIAKLPSPTRFNWTRNLVGIGLALGMVIPLAQTVVAANERLMQTDSREVARNWLESNLPVGTRLAQESYTPYLDTRRYIVQGVSGVIDHSADWYIQNGFEYLIFGQGMYARYFAEPDRYADLVRQYNEFFNRFPLVQQFNDNDYEIRVYKTSTILPSHRIAARFGNYGELIELVGYDSDLPQVVPGKPLTVNLWWRPVSESREPLELEMRLLDQNNHEIASARGDLFQSKGWRDGMFQTAWTFAVPQEISAGAYRVDVSVIQSRFSYRTPARTWAGEIFDLVSLGPW